jgi:hypothetical protein
VWDRAWSFVCVIPAQAGIHLKMGPGLRRDDGIGSHTRPDRIVLLQLSS